jgi:hypothetical protein
MYHLILYPALKPGDFRFSFPVIYSRLNNSSQQCVLYVRNASENTYKKARKDWYLQAIGLILIQKSQGERTIFESLFAGFKKVGLFVSNSALEAVL